MFGENEELFDIMLKYGGISLLVLSESLSLISKEKIQANGIIDTLIILIDRCKKTNKKLE